MDDVVESPEGIGILADNGQLKVCVTSYVSLVTYKSNYINRQCTTLHICHSTIKGEGGWEQKFISTVDEAGSARGQAAAVALCSSELLRGWMVEPSSVCRKGAFGVVRMMVLL